MKVALLAGAACLLLLAGCGTTTVSTSPVSGSAAPAVKASPSPAVPSPSRQVRAILRKGNAALAVAKRNPNNDASFRSMARVLTRGAEQLRGLTYPPAAVADAKALEADLSKLASDCSMMIKPTDLTVVSAVAAQIVADEGAETADRAALSHDLGVSLPRQ
jgi:hypothetical protein